MSKCANENRRFKIRHLTALTVHGSVICNRNTTYSRCYLGYAFPPTGEVKQAMEQGDVF